MTRDITTAGAAVKPLHSPSKYRRRASSVHSVETIFAAARKVCEDQGQLPIMTEYITMHPFSLSFRTEEVEKSYIQDHKEKYLPRFRPLMLTITVCLLLTGIPDVLAHHSSRIIFKIIAAAISFVVGVLSTSIYWDDLKLALASALIAYFALFTRILMENEEGELFLQASEKDVGFIFLIYAILSTIIGLRFIVSLAISFLIAILTLASIWTAPNSDSNHLKFEASSFVLLGFFFFNLVLLRKAEIQERRDFRLTKRLAAENVHVKMQMENFTLFSKGIAPRNGGGESSSSAVAPGGVLSLGSRISAVDIEVQNTIGCGSYGDVMKGKYKATTVAIKKIRKDLAEDTLVEIGAESSLMADLRHPNIVMFMGLCLYPPMMVMEYCSRGSVFNAIHVDRSSMDWSLLLRILMDAAHGMAFLHQHEPPIIHRDLKSLNLLLDENWRCKVSDFGLSKLKKMRAQEPEHSPIGSIPWMAPEIASTDGICEKVDVFSFGIIIFEFLAKEMPYNQTPMQGIPYLVSKGKRPTDFYEIKDAPASLEGLERLMKLCWQAKPDQRPEFETIIEIFQQEICPAYFGDVPMHDAIVFPREKNQEETDQEAALKNLRFNISEDELTIGPKIGGGAFGAVYTGKWLGTDVAIKQMFISSLPEKVLVEFNKECDLMRQLRHPNIVLFLGSSAQPPNLFLVTELLSKGSLFDIYHSEKRSHNMVRHYGLVVKIAADMARGMAYLHSRSPPLIHRDLKSPNIMVDSHWTSKIGDFGLSRLKDENKTMTKCGSPLWVAPEVLQGQRFAEGCDIYSFAIIVWEAMAWSEPYPNMSAKKVMKEVVVQGLRPTIPPECPEGFRALIASCWKSNPNDRPSFTQVLEQLEYIESIQCSK